jgi:hypothetical protein
MIWLTGCFQVLELSRLTQQSSFRHCNNLLETLWKQLPLVAKNMGKKCGAHPRVDPQ